MQRAASASPLVPALCSTLPYPTAVARQPFAATADPDSDDDVLDVSIAAVNSPKRAAAAVPATPSGPLRSPPAFVTEFLSHTRQGGSTTTPRSGLGMGERGHVHKRLGLEKPCF
jgi:hypothetical protein